MHENRKAGEASEKEDKRKGLEEEGARVPIRAGGVRALHAHNIIHHVYQHPPAPSGLLNPSLSVSQESRSIAEALGHSRLVRPAVYLLP